MRHRKTLCLARELTVRSRDSTVPSRDVSVHRVTAAGHMVALWCWAVDNAPSGDLTGLSPDIIAFGAEWDGDPKVFNDALCASGFLDITPDRIHIHDWEFYTGRFIDQRTAHAEKMRLARAQKRERTVQSPIRHSSVTDTSRDGTTVHNTIVHNTKGLSIQPTPETQKPKVTRIPPDPRIDELFTRLELIRGYKSGSYMAERTAVRGMFTEGVSLEEILDCYADKKRELFWRDKPLSMGSLRKQVGEWKINLARNGTFPVTNIPGKPQEVSPFAKYGRSDL